MSASAPIVKHDNNHDQPLNQASSNTTPHDELTNIHSTFDTYTNGTFQTVEEETKIGDDDDGVTERPSKKRKLEDFTSRPRSRSRAVSPPWKPVAANGPTTVIVDGKRKSTRFNPIPPERSPESDKRTTRRAASRATQSNGLVIDGVKQNGSRSVSSPAFISKSKIQTSLRKTPSATSLKSTPTKPTQRLRKPSDADISSPPMTSPVLTTGKRGPGRPRKHPISTPEDSKTRRFTRASDVSQQSQDFTTPNGYHNGSHIDMLPPGPTPRLKLRLRLPSPPIRNPKHVPLPKPFDTLAEWLQHDDPLTGEESQRITLRKARQEAEIRWRIVEAAENGVLSRERCSIFNTEPAAEPPPIYGHYAHVVAHALTLGKLIKKESEDHRRLAKRIAYEAVEKWKEKYKRKTQEEIEQEEKAYAVLRYKQLVRDVKESWVLVKQEVDKARQAKWEEEQHKKGTAAMATMVDQSQILLRRGRLETSSFVSDERDDENDDEDEHTSGSDEADDENFSSGDEDEEEDNANDEDATLTREQLLAKYGQLPDIPMDDVSEEEQDEEREESADEKLERNSEDTGYDYGRSEPIQDEDEDLLDADDDEDMDQVADRTSPCGDEDYDDTLVPTSPSATGFKDGPHILTNGIHTEDMPDDNDNINNIEANPTDSAIIELEEVDEVLLDSEDEENKPNGSESGSEAWSDSEAESAEMTETGSDTDDEDAYDNTLGFLASDEIKKIKKANMAALSVEPEEPGITMHGVNGDTRDSEVDEQGTSAELPNGTTHHTTHTDTNGVSTSPDVDVVDEDDSKEKTSISRSRDISSPPRTEIPSLLRGTLREYQHDGLNWLANLYEGDTNGILADEMGLGKTIQTIALLAYLAVHRGVWGPHLVVVPTSVMLNWEMEFKKWCPGFKILTYYGEYHDRQKKRKGWLDDNLYNVVITSYQLILQDAAAFKRRAWHYLILDEAHNIKNFKTQRWQTLLTFRTQRRLLLTGTPLQNNIDELWSLLYFLMPAGFAGEGRIAGLQDFSMALKKPTNQILEQGKQVLDTEGQKIVRKLHEVLRPYLLRRMKSDVEKQMPGKYEHIVYCRLSKRQRQLYDGFMGRADTKQTLASGNYMSIINCLMSLRKVCNHPDLFETRQIVTSFAMPKSVVASFEIKDLLIRKRLFEGTEDETVNLNFLGLLPVQRESTSMLHAIQTRHIRATRPLEDLIAQQSRRINVNPNLDGSSINSIVSYMAEKEDMSALEHLKNCLRLTRQRTQFMPAYGKGLIDRLSLNLQDKFTSRYPRRSIDSEEWYFNTSSTLLDMVPTLDDRARSLEPIIQKFGCVTPAVVANDMGTLVLSEPGVELIRQSPLVVEKDPFHEPRIRLSIAFPDKRLLQYDCGKLQRLAILLRELQAGGHRALIFTQMTKVLDILEQFLNIHGYRYLRLDGATKVEQRQILTDRFNTDDRILCFILSSRSGGLGINLTGADTVIFYDLDWNPAMDKQCQDRCHRIGQTRDVHIYKFVSEYTIEANILRKSNQKRLLDDVIIQRGDFTTDYFNKVSWRDAFDDGQPVDEASAAMDRVLGDAAGLGEVIQSVEDTEDATAAKVAQKEIVEVMHDDEGDFVEAVKSETPKVADGDGEKETEKVPEKEVVVDKERRHVDEYMLEVLVDEWINVPWQPPDKGKTRDRRGKDPHRVKRRRN
ncbi:hypothetical protein K432DRAFT_377542 [Lepidopterella palustris CBS 459.81]|uniref:DNA helicase n=1 Tax=Lepidopterella palustris CBS 459.81 TaxID=1314670 RepID=A0A8E2EK67_9PEZI|nr:hypothetical protein K432DRAFT_377542 [Lepidopterella palustris CBS 459.81]